MFKVEVSGVRKKINAINLDSINQLNISVEKLASDSADSMRGIIKTRGTAFSRFRQSLGVGSSGRVRSGHMLESVGFKIKKNNSGLTVNIGYTKDEQPYFIFQEKGFQNWWRFASFGYGTFGPNAPQGFIFLKTNSIKTPGIFALRDTARDVMAKKKSVGTDVKSSIKKKFGR